MIGKLLTLLLTLLILACPFNCMQSSAEDTDTAVHSCCSHCQPPSSENPLAPEPASSDSCQCFCSGAILENADQFEQANLIVLWFAIPQQDAIFQQISINHQTDIVLLDAVPPSGRALRCLQMSYQC
ncbi:hypothetical protein Enr17x_33460 [Gimesia fumaroli]|uniref:Secreted protein n=1 Tax=Gimesia fumaroli TaxID=2527976 RepID=A0A518IDW1_9PLAN|nr:hypothetical protein Enr17x_33460 [Gimesia fumaroli]